MELILNRLQYKCAFNDVKIIVSNESNALTYSIQWKYFVDKFTGKSQLLAWAKQNEVDSESRISYEFSKKEDTPYFSLPLITEFNWRYTFFEIGQSLLNQGMIVDFHPKALTLSCYLKKDEFDEIWGIYKRIDFILKYNDSNHIGEAIFNIGSHQTFISNAEMEIIEEYHNVKCVTDGNRVSRPRHLEQATARLVANREIIDKYHLQSARNPINYSRRYKELLNFFNVHLKAKEFDTIKFISTGFDSREAQKVSFNRNRMVFKNENKDINPITGMRNYGVYRAAPNASETKFIFIFQHNDDANTLYKYLKNGYKGFPGLERYVGIPIVLADSLTAGHQYKQLQFKSLVTLFEEYQDFENIELSDDYYENHFALVIGGFSKDEPQQVYYDLKLALLAKGIPSQFINQLNIRKSSVFNYHLPNIAIGIHAKLGGIPWRIDSNLKKELIIGFNQDFNRDRDRYIAGSVFFDNHGNLKRNFAFPEEESSTTIIKELRKAVNAFLEENEEIERIVIHYHKTLSKKEKRSIERLFREEFDITVPYAVVEINDTKSRIELAFDPMHNNQMPVSGSFVRLSRKEYLLFNNNRFKAEAPVGVKDELPLKIKVHFADESGFSHKELIEQVYEFSRLIWKGLKQRSQPATCFYAHEIARFRAHANGPIPENEITQTTPWVI